MFITGSMKSNTLLWPCNILLWSLILKKGVLLNKKRDSMLLKCANKERECFSAEWGSNFTSKRWHCMVDRNKFVFLIPSFEMWCSWKLSHLFTLWSNNLFVRDYLNVNESADCLSVLLFCLNSDSDIHQTRNLWFVRERNNALY